MKNEKNFTNKKPDATPYFCKRNFSRMHHVDFIHTLCLCSFPCLEPMLQVCGADQAEQQWRHWQQSMNKINMVHPRKISLAESRGRCRFFKVKSGVQFWFWALFRKSYLLQPSLGKLYLSTASFAQAVLGVAFQKSDIVFHHR